MALLDETNLVCIGLRAIPNGSADVPYRTKLSVSVTPSEILHAPDSGMCSPYGPIVPSIVVSSMSS